MQWTMGQRIAIGYVLIFLLLVVVAAVGTISLSSTAGTFELTIHTESKKHKRIIEQKANTTQAITGLLRYLILGEETFVKGWEAGIVEARRTMTQLQETAPTPELKSEWGEALGLLTQWEHAAQRAILAKRAGRQEEAIRIMENETAPVWDRRVALVDRLVDSELTHTAEVTQSAVAGASRAVWVMLIVTAAILVFGGLIGWGLTRSISRSFRETIATLASASAEIVAATTQQAAGAAEETTAVQETSTTVDEVRQVAQSAAQKAKAVADAAQKTAQVTQDGRRAVEDSVKGMQEAKARMEAIAERILALSEQGQEIGAIIATVNGLAEQSNLLAVNASIEAAKAGEAGKGFAVVATEVKALAEQSKQATAQVRGILREIQRATQAAVMAAEQGVKASEAGEGIARQAGEAIGVLAQSVSEAAQAAQQILVSAQQQLAGMDQVVTSMQYIQQASAQNMSSTQQVERAAQDLNTLAHRLRTLVGGNGSQQGTGNSRPQHLLTRSEPQR